MVPMMRRSRVPRDGVGAGAPLLAIAEKFMTEQAAM